MQAEKQNIDLKELGSTLLRVGVVLISSGANTGRVKITIKRIAESFGCNIDLLITQKSLMLTLSNDETDEVFNSLMGTPVHGVNFKVVSGISRMSWQIASQKWTLGQINQELERLTSLPHYNRAIMLSVVGLAGAAFCRLAGGDVLDMIIVFAATAIGLLVRQHAMKMRFNFYLCVYFASLVASSIAGASLKFGQGYVQQYAVATSVLFLIPGVPLINSFSDMIDGNLQNGIIRGLNGLIISFAIAIGLLTSKFIFQL